MKLGQVLGRVVLNTQDPAYTGGRFLVVHPLDRKQLSGGALKDLTPGVSIVAWDELGAGDGDVVGYSESGEAAAPFENPTPVDAYICAILDHWTYQPQT